MFSQLTIYQIAYSKNIVSVSAIIFFNKLLFACVFIPKRQANKHWWFQEPLGEWRNNLQIVKKKMPRDNSFFEAPELMIIV